jgi:hypothetical protein
MVVMQGETQGKWLHAIPKRTRAEPRIKYLIAPYVELKIASRSAELSTRPVPTIIIITMSMRGIYFDGWTGKWSIQERLDIDCTVYIEKLQ